MPAKSAPKTPNTIPNDIFSHIVDSSNEGVPVHIGPPSIDELKATNTMLKINSSIQPRPMPFRAFAFGLLARDDDDDDLLLAR